MADFVTDSLRMDTGRSLNQMYMQATDSINRLKSLKTKLLQLRSDITANADGIYTVADADKTQEIINQLGTDLADI